MVVATPLKVIHPKRSLLHEAQLNLHVFPLSDEHFFNAMLHRLDDARQNNRLVAFESLSNVITTHNIEVTTLFQSQVSLRFQYHLV